MKKMLACILLLAASGMLSAQNALTLNVVNAKSKSLGNKAVVSLKSNTATQRLDKDTPLKLWPAATDTLYVTVGNTMGIIPTGSLTTLTLVAEKGKISNQDSGEEYPVVKLPPFDPNNIGNMPQIAMFVNLENLIAVKFPAVRIQHGQAYLLSNISAGYSGNYTPMLIVVDGNPVQNFGYVNEAINIREIKSIVVKRSDVIYGMRGEGGVMEITLLKGTDR